MVALHAPLAPGLQPSGGAARAGGGGRPGPGPRGWARADSGGRPRGGRRGSEARGPARQLRPGGRRRRKPAPPPPHRSASGQGDDAARRLAQRGPGPRVGPRQSRGSRGHARRGGGGAGGRARRGQRLGRAHREDAREPRFRCRSGERARARALAGGRSHALERGGGGSARLRREAEARVQRFVDTEGSMDFALTAEQEELVKTLRAFARKELAPRSRDWDRTGEFPWSAWRQMGELGLLGLRIPAAYGGQESDYLTFGLAMEEVARGDFGCTYGI